MSAVDDQEVAFSHHGFFLFCSFFFMVAIFDSAHQRAVGIYQVGETLRTADEEFEQNAALFSGKETSHEDTSFFPVEHNTL